MFRLRLAAKHKIVMMMLKAWWGKTDIFTSNLATTSRLFEWDKGR